MSARTSDFKLHTSNFKHAVLGPLTLIMLLFCPVGQAALKGGCSKVNITPPLGVTLIGSYGKPSDTVMDDLYAEAMVLSDGRNTIAIVAPEIRCPSNGGPNRASRLAKR